MGKHRVMVDSAWDQHDETGILGGLRVVLLHCTSVAREVKSRLAEVLCRYFTQPCVVVLSVCTKVRSPHSTGYGVFALRSRHPKART